MHRSQSWGAAATMSGIGTFTIIVVTLDLLQPKYDPKSQLMSELALGHHGWAMLVAFLGLAVAIFGVQAAIADVGGTISYRTLLGFAALFFLAAGIFRWVQHR